MTLKLFWFVALKNTFQALVGFWRKNPGIYWIPGFFSNIMYWKIDPNMGIKIRDAWNFSLDSFKEALMPKSHIKRNIVLLFFGFEISSKQLQPLLKLGNKLSTSLGLLLLAPCQEDVQRKRSGHAGWMIGTWWRWQRCFACWANKDCHLLSPILNPKRRYNTNIERIMWEVPHMLFPVK